MLYLDSKQTQIKMAKATIYKPILSKNDVYQESVNTNYQRDQTTGELFKTSGNNVRTIIPEQIKCENLIQKQLIVSNTSFDNLYIVPKGYVFILNYVTLQSSFNISAATITSVRECKLTLGNSSTIGISHTIFHVNGSISQFGFSDVITPSNTLIYDQDARFKLTSDINSSCSASISGYLIKKSDINFNIPTLLI